MGTNVRMALLVLFIMIVSVTDVKAVTYYSRADGTWSTTNGGASCSCTPGQNDVIIVNHNITLAGPFTLNTGTFTVNAGTLTISGDLTFNNGSFVTVAQNAGIKVNGNFFNKNNSNDIAINGSLNVTGSFQNGQGSGAGAVITVGSTGSISFGGSCSSPGTIIDGSGVSHTGCNNGPLPVTFLYFEGETDGNIVDLRWATSSEKNLDYFEIERSADGNVFVAVASVGGSINSEVKQTYSYTDKTPLSGHNYYRIKTVDLDGYTEYYDELILLNITTERVFNVYPNPFHSGTLSVQLNHTPSASATIQIKDLMGNINYSQNTKSIVTELTPGSLKAGFYILEVFDATEVHRERIIIE